MKAYLQMMMYTFLYQCCYSTDQAPCRFPQYIPSSEEPYPIHSPGYPNNFRSLTTCFWYLYTDPGCKMKLNCRNVSLQSNEDSSCADSMTVHGISGYETDKMSYCREFSVTSSSNKLLLSSDMSSGGSFSCTVYTRGTVTPKTKCDCGERFQIEYPPGEAGGVVTLVNEFPSMAGLIDARKKARVCGAAIISHKYVLTAAHCLNGLEVPTTGILVAEHDFYTGEDRPDVRLYRSRRFVRHPDYVARPAKHDIALIEVAGEIKSTPRVGPACLPFNRPHFPAVGEQLSVLGRGTTSFGGPTSKTLRKTQVSAVAREGCLETFNASDPTVEDQICIYSKGQDSCQMDSGGPLLSDSYLDRYFLAGLVSYGNGCAGENLTVNTRVYGYLDWISSVAGGPDHFCIK